MVVRGPTKFWDVKAPPPGALTVVCVAAVAGIHQHHTARQAGCTGRAIGVIYRPETELASHYFQANLPQQFDEYVWLDETRAVTQLETAEIKGLPDTYPFWL